MSITTLSTVYTYSDTYTSATAYTAKNNAIKNWIESMAGASIPGLTYYDRLSPDVNPTAPQAFSITFQTTQGYYLKFHINSNTATNIGIYFGFVTENGVYSNTQIANYGLTYASGVATVGLNLVRYFSENIYDIYALSPLTASTTFYPCGAMYLENKTSTAPDYIVCMHTFAAGIYDTKNNRAITTLSAGEPDGTTGTCIMMDAPVFYDGDFLATIKNAKNIGASATSVSLATYMVSGLTYIAVANRYIYVHVT